MMGRPPKELNERAFRNMCRRQCTGPEIEAFLDVDHKTIDNWCKRTFDMTFSQCIKKFGEGGKASLRRSMWKKATIEKNTTMMIWLSKQYLGMSDKIEDDRFANLKPIIIQKSDGEQIKMGLIGDDKKED